MTGTAAPVTTTEEPWGEYTEKHWVLLVLIFVEIALVVGLYALHRHWSWYQGHRAQRAGVHRQSEAYAQSIVRNLLPSIRVQRHRFRGLRPKATTLSIAFEDLGLKLHSGGIVLAGVTGKFQAGRLCAIMGPSGAGKTTFMNVLCGKATYGEMTGEVYINGKPGDISDYKPIMGFVPQDDIVHDTLTVSEQISFSAILRGPSGITRRQTQQITDDVLSVMQIDHIRNSIVGSVVSRGISGGQRKRVNIGLELAADPTVLFLDEPTSGLDATSSLTIVHSLKRLTELGMTAIMVIHQPRYSLFTLFDDVLLLGKGGQTVYLGPSSGAKAYFEGQGFRMPANENPADWFMDVISGEVENQNFPKFAPAMLFTMWETREEIPVPRKESVRRWTMSDDRASLLKTLEEAWNDIDTDKNGVLDQEELRLLLARCEGTEPDTEVVSELFQNMSEGRDAVVQKQDFMDYLLSLQDVVTEAQVETESSSDLSDSEAPSPHYFSMKALVKHHGNPSGRSSQGFLTQFGTLLLRKLVQWWRSNLERLVSLGVVAFASVILGVMDTYVCKADYWKPEAWLNLHTSLALLTSVFCLRVFGVDQSMFWRECSSGLSIPAFFLARVLVNVVDLMLQCFLFASIYFFIRQIELDFGFYFLPFVLVSFAASGVGYFISSVLPPQHGPFVAALVSFVSCGLLGHPQRVHQMQDGGYLEIGMGLASLTRWSVGMSFLKTIDTHRPYGLDPRSELELEALEQTYRRTKTDAGYWNSGIYALLLIGFTLHVAAYLGLRFANRDKRV